MLWIKHPVNTVWVPFAESPATEPVQRIFKGASGRLFLLTETHLWTSTNNGLSWTDQAGQLPASQVILNFDQGVEMDFGPDGFALLTSKLNAHRLFFSSQDDGTQWQWETGDFLRPNISQFVADQNHRLFAQSNEHWFGSEDNGQTWTRIPVPGNYGLIHVIRTAPGNALYALCTVALARSDDGGATWTELPVVVGPGCAFFVLHGEKLFLRRQNGTWARSDDEGQNWVGLGLNSFSTLYDLPDGLLLRPP